MFLSHTHAHANKYLQFGKYTDPLTSSTFCFITATQCHQVTKQNRLLYIFDAPELNFEAHSKGSEYICK